jgi:Rrf2 family protein
MKYSQAIEWAVCVLALLATEEQMVTNEELNRRLNVSASYLKKITRKLVVGGLIKSSYGSKGGYLLARDMKKITLYDLVDAIDGHSPFFQPSGLMEVVFSTRIKKVELGKNLLAKAFLDAQNRFDVQMKKTTMAHIFAELKRG